MLNANDTTSWIEYSVERGPIRGPYKAKIGLMLNVKARPEIESFMQQLSNDSVVAADAYANEWINLSAPDAKPFDVYQIDDKWKSRDRSYTLTSVGALPLIFQENRNGIIPGTELVNLSFLRIVGLTKNENGIRIGFDGAYSAQYIKSMRDTLATATAQFLKDYVVPITFNLHIINRM